MNYLHEHLIFLGATVDLIVVGHLSTDFPLEVALDLGKDRLWMHV